MSVLIIDDDDFKAGQQKKDLLDLGYKEIHRGRCLIEALDKVEQLTGELELVVLDWNFPTLFGELPVVGEGELVLDELDRVESEVPVIICSGDKVVSKAARVVAVTSPNTFHSALKCWKRTQQVVDFLVVQQDEVVAIKLQDKIVDLRELATQIQNHSLEITGTVWEQNKSLLTECEAFKGFPKLKAFVKI